MSATLLLVHIIGTIALMLWGMRMVRTGVERAAGDSLGRRLESWTRNRVVACLSGIVATLALQSSTATAILINGFVVRNAVSTSAALAVILGADIGTTLVAAILSFDLSMVAPFLIAAGFIGHSSSEQTAIRQYSRAAMGLGVVLLALQLLRSHTSALTDSDVLPVIVTALADEPVIAVIVFALTTWLLHSSLAAVLFTASLAASGLIDRELTLLLVLGANLGAGFPVFSSTAGQDARQRRAPLGNIIFRSIGVVVALILLEQIVLYSALLSLDPVQYTIAMHIAFNVLLALAFLPMTSPFAAYLDKKYPKPVSTEDEQWNSSLLSNAIITDPDAALSAAARETIRLGAVVQGMFHDVIIALRENDRNLAKEIASRDDQVDYLHREIKLYVTDASRLELSETQSARATQILTFVTDIEHIGDIIESVAGYARRKSIKGLQFSDAGMEDLENMYQRVLKSMHTAFDVFMSGDKTLADQLIKEKRSVGRLERTLARAHLRRLRDGLSQSIETSSFHQDVLRDFKRIHSHLVAVAYTTIAIGQPLETEDDF